LEDKAFKEIIINHSECEQKSFFLPKMYIRMAKSKSKYVFKYNKEGQLYNYVELNKMDKIISYFNLKNNKLIRFDKSTQTKQLITFKSNVKLKQKFMAGESFISVFDLSEDENVQYSMPEKEKEITLIKDNVRISDFGKFVVERWKKLNKTENIDYTKKPEENSIKTTNFKEPSKITSFLPKKIAYR